MKRRRMTECEIRMENGRKERTFVCIILLTFTKIIHTVTTYAD